MPTIREIYKQFGIKFDVRAARKLLGLERNTARPVVNELMRERYLEIEKETNKIYSYRFRGFSQYPYVLKNGNRIYSQRQPISISFTTRRKLNTLNIKRPYTQGQPIGGNDLVGDLWMEQGDGSDKVNTITHFTERLVQRTSRLNNIPMFNSSILVADSRYNGFRDTGNHMCVPETLLHHLKLRRQEQETYSRQSYSFS